MPTQIRLAIADDHKLMRSGFIKLLEQLGFEVVLECDNGHELVSKIAGMKANIVLMDVNMPVMDGVEATRLLRRRHPGIKVIAVSMNNDEISIIRMLRAGAKGYVLKNEDPEELRKAIRNVADKGFHYSEVVAAPLVQSLLNPTEGGDEVLPTQLSEKEITFMRYACSELNYREIAEMMHCSARTVDGYRDDLFSKLKVKTRVGLVLYAIKYGIFAP